MQNHSITMTTTTTKRDLIVNVIDNESLRKGKNKQMINDIDTVDDDHDIQGHHYIIINHIDSLVYKKRIFCYLFSI